MTSQRELTDERNARFMALLRPIHTDCERWAYTLAGNTADAQDVLEDGILTALKSFHQLKNESAFKTWIFQILRRAHLMAIRKRRRDAEAVEPDTLDRVAPGTAGGAVAADRAKVLQAALSALAPEQKQALMLFELSELSIREVSQVMGKSESAVRVLLHRARHRLEGLLRQAGIGPDDGTG